MKFCLGILTLYFGISHALALDIDLSATPPNVNPLLYCLGQEEALIYKQDAQGPIYRLNQKMTAKFANAAELQAKPDFLRRICKNSEFTPSVALLYHLIFDGKSMFLPSVSKAKLAIKYYDAMIYDVLQQTPATFLTYLSDLQAVTPMAGCLNREIPEVQRFQHRMMALQNELGAIETFKHNDLVKRIFKKLKNFGKYYNQCTRSADQKEQS